LPQFVQPGAQVWVEPQQPVPSVQQVPPTPQQIWLQHGPPPIAAQSLLL
jgi:hypothetical protein